uniref:Uncharacterized protein n=1 Tax=Anopheles farauti TaxID=69004 RepID=A0A182QR01_9DIPT
MTVGSVKHTNVLPQPAAASSTRVSTAYDYNGTGAGGVGGGGHGVGGGGASLRAGGIGGGRISPHSPSVSSTGFGKMRSATKRTLFGRPDPIETKRIYDEHEKAERQRALNRYGFDPYTGRGLTTAASSSASGPLHHRLHHHQTTPQRELQEGVKIVFSLHATEPLRKIRYALTQHVCGRRSTE